MGLTRLLAVALRFRMLLVGLAAGLIGARDYHAPEDAHRCAAGALPGPGA